MKHPRSSLIVSVFIHVERLIPYLQILFASVQPSALVTISNVHTSTKFGDNRCKFQLLMICFLFTDPKTPCTAPFSWGICGISINGLFRASICESRRLLESLYGIDLLPLER